MQSVDIVTYRLYEGDATSQHTFALARLLRRRGLQVSIICQEQIGQVPSDIRRLARQVHYADYLADAELTILQYPIWYPLAERFRVATGRRIFWYHGVTPPEYWSAAAERDILRTAQTRTDLARFAHIAVAASPYTADELQTHAGLSADQVRVVPLGVDIARFARPPAPEKLAALRRRWNLPPVVPQQTSSQSSPTQNRVILYVGRVAGNKRLDLLIDGLALLARREEATELGEVHLLIVGDTADGVATQDLVRQLTRQAQSAGVGHRVIFTGRVKQVEPYYHLADLYVQCSQHEGFGAPLVEAMAAGTPVVASSSAALPWVLGLDELGTEEAGLTFVPGDVDDLARQLRRCLRDEELVRSLVAAGRVRTRVFDVSRFDQRAWSIIEEASRRAASTRPEVAIADEDSLLAHADVANRAYRISSSLPLIGGIVAGLRRQSTVHIKEAYLDRIVERQVNFNRLLARQIADLQAAVDAKVSAAPVEPAQTERSTLPGTDPQAPGPADADRPL